ncbi:phosphoacetylglucosamine mutase-like [Phymastichus coffea]|uniref:phosphoacetylglucosamine mutase-like n=1 Tax=Phymastichus coffea TaxID=108790 RepID=UPI00273BDDFD|nr:phosphoacetylglucosamine mutase-like [Phymastichus coffea]
MLRTFINQNLQPSIITKDKADKQYVPSWKRSITELNSFVDILASELLLPWEVLEDAPTFPITAAPHQKVLSWLGMTENNQQDPLLLDDNHEQPRIVTHAQSPNAIQRPNTFEENHDSDFIQAFLPKVKSQKVPVSCVPTGVKHLHHKAMEYDIGVYFEVNGHGTVIFKDSAHKTIKAAAQDNSLPKSEQKAALILKYVIDVINQTVGDALSDMLLVELILHAKGWDVVTWQESYEDLPNKQVKVKVQDRNAITTTDAERCCVTPKRLQEEINKIVSKYPRGCSFVRPSGTEDIVRVYAECESYSDIEKLTAEVSLSVYNLAGGIGEILKCHHKLK